MWKFVKSSPNPNSWLDHNFCEIAFIGRSNIGKSSLINALLSQKIAISSKTPGRTQMINFFQKENKVIVDLPGYGYAKISKIKQNQISNNLNYYFLNRKQLDLVCLLISCSIGITVLDKMMIKLLQEYQISFILIATKKDKSTQKQIYKTILQMKDYTDQCFICSIKESKTIELLKDKLNNYL